MKSTRLMRENLLRSEINRKRLFQAKQAITYEPDIEKIKFNIDKLKNYINNLISIRKLNLSYFYSPKNFIEKGQSFLLTYFTDAANEVIIRGYELDDVIKLISEEIEKYPDRRYLSLILENDNDFEHLLICYNSYSSDFTDDYD